MMNDLFRSHLIVKKSPIHGYGVFAVNDITQGDLIEECYTILTLNIDKSFINHYFLADKYNAMLAGYGCIYNHSSSPNAEYYYDKLRNITIFKATKNIQQGEEVLISYGKKWFSSRNMPISVRAHWKNFFYFLKSLPFKVGVVVTILLIFISIIQRLPLV